MLLQELFTYKLLEAIALTSSFPLWVNPQTGQSFGEDEVGAESHAYVLGLYAREMGLSEDLIRTIPNRYEDSELHEWARDNDRFDSMFHQAAYNNHWVRWYYDGFNEIDISGLKEDVLLILFSPQFTRLIKDSFEQTEKELFVYIELFVNPLNGTHSDEKSYRQRLLNASDLNELRRRVQSA